MLGITIQKKLWSLKTHKAAPIIMATSKGAHRIPVTISSDRLAKGSGTTTYDLSSHIKNDGTYIRFEIKGSGLTTGLTAGDVYLIFEDPSDPLLELTYTIQEGSRCGLIDPIAFRYTSMSSTILYMGYIEPVYRGQDKLKKAIRMLIYSSDRMRSTRSKR